MLFKLNENFGLIKSKQLISRDFRRFQSDCEINPGKTTRSSWYTAAQFVHQHL